MTRGTARRVTVSGVEEFAQIIGGLRSYQGIALGSLREGLGDEERIVTKAKLNGAKNGIARSRENFVFRKGKPALAPIDLTVTVCRKRCRNVSVTMSGRL